MKYLAIILCVIAAGCSVDVSHELAGPMSVVEKTEVDGKQVCRLFARKRQLSEVVDLLNPKFEESIVVSDSIDVDQMVPEVDIQADDWRSVLTELAERLDLKVEDQGQSLLLVDPN